MHNRVSLSSLLGLYVICTIEIPALKRWAICEFAKIRWQRTGICVVRIGDRYRAVDLREGDVIAWFWIGTHDQYNRFHF